MKDRLTQFCEAIRDYEGSPGDLNYRNNNPGNCRFEHVTYRSIYGEVKCDPHGFAIFKDYETGFLYLKNMIRQRIERNPGQSLYQFMSIYSPSSDDNDPHAYASWIAKKLGIGLDTHMGIILS